MVYPMVITMVGTCKGGSKQSFIAYAIQTTLHKGQPVGFNGILPSYPVVHRYLSARATRAERHSLYVFRNDLSDVGGTGFACLACWEVLVVLFRPIFPCRSIPVSSSSLGPANTFQSNLPNLNIIPLGKFGKEYSLPLHVEQLQALPHWWCYFSGSRKQSLALMACPFFMSLSIRISRQCQYLN